MNKFINSLKILRGLAKDDVFLAATNLLTDNSKEKENDFAYAVFNANAYEDIDGYIFNLIKYDVNAFSVYCANHTNPPKVMTEAFVDDLKNICKLLKVVREQSRFGTHGKECRLNENTLTQTAYSLIDFYTKNGYGDFAKYKAFAYRNDKIIPVTSPSPVRLNDLKDYEEEKRLIINNVKDFLNGLPYAHTLLYGDKGTGKSSTVHAILNEFFNNGLRLIEIRKEDISSINQLREKVNGLPLKFIIFIDDLTFGENDPQVSSLKAAIEGSVINGDNTMVVATSNKRHIVSESFTAREDALHPNDLKEEQLSLSDRFGLTVIFSNTDKTAYLSIVKQLAEEYNVTLPYDELETLAERWALFKGGRSPRRAEQFIRLAYASQTAGRKIEF